MKIAQVNVYFYPCMVGGAEWYVYNISRELVRRGHEVHVYATDRYEGKKIVPAEDIVEGVHVHRVPLWLDLTYRVKIWKQLDKHLIQENFDIIHAYDYAQPHSYIAVNVGKITRKPVALTIFDLHSVIPHPFYKRLFLKSFDKYVARFILRKASRLLVRTPFLIGPLLRMGAPENKIVVTPSGIPKESLIAADGREFRRKYAIDGHLVLYVGRLHYTKGLQFLVKSFPAILDAFPDAKLVMVGPDHVGYKKKLVKLAEALKVKESMLVLNSIYEVHEKMQVYAASNVFVLPSGYEGFGQVLVEAMAQGKPIVATNVGGIPYLVKNGVEGFLINYGDTDAIANSVLKVLSNDELAMDMGLRGKERAAIFTYDALANQLEQIYKVMKEEQTTNV